MIRAEKKRNSFVSSEKRCKNVSHSTKEFIGIRLRTFSEHLAIPPSADRADNGGATANDPKWKNRKTELTHLNELISFGHVIVPFAERAPIAFD